MTNESFISIINCVSIVNILLSVFLNKNGKYYLNFSVLLNIYSLIFFILVNLNCLYSFIFFLYILSFVIAIFYLNKNIKFKYIKYFFNLLLILIIIYYFYKLLLYYNNFEIWILYTLIIFFIISFLIPINFIILLFIFIRNKLKNN